MEQKASQLRNEVMAIKDRIYTGIVKLDKKRCTHYILVCEIWIMPFAEKREKWLKHVNGNSISLEKRPLETQGTSNKLRKTYMGNKTPAMNSHAPADISRPKKITDMLKMACEKP